MLVPSNEDGTPLRFPTYFSLSINSLAHNLIKESVKLHKEIHHTSKLLRQAKTMPDGIKKDEAPKGLPTIAYRGGVPPSRYAPTRHRRMSAKVFCALFNDPLVKRRQDGPPRSLIPLTWDDACMDDDYEEDPEEPAPNRMVTATRTNTFGNPSGDNSSQQSGAGGSTQAGDHHKKPQGNIPPTPPLPKNMTIALFIQVLWEERQANSATMQKMAQVLVNNEQQERNGNGRSTLSEFDLLALVNCNEDHEKVLYASHYLGGTARSWWDGFKIMQGDHVITWADFKEGVRTTQIYSGIMAIKKREFRALKQGSGSIKEYMQKFNLLSRKVKFFECGQPGHISKQSPNSPNQGQGDGPPPSNPAPHNHTNNGKGHVNHVIAEEAQEGPNVTLGTFLVN
ncbi:Retrotransposon protein, putative, Ty3-gypsy sub-class [Hordeum vulgare]|nr:Retrotransposon protein, putative, Ty3-gypsy sub-class [Hordeum vulgare]